MSAHAELAPSASHRWISCPGSISLSRMVPPSKSSKYADEGVAAHKLAELCITNACTTDIYLGKVIEGFTVTDEMADAVQVYLDKVTSLQTAHSIVVAEKKFDISWLVPGIRGTNDSFVWDMEQKTLNVLDYKHGAGIVVDAEWNPQLMIYAIGALKSIWDIQTEKTKQAIPIQEIVSTINLIIVQPRAYSAEGPVRAFSITAKDLLFWGMNVLKPAAEMTAVKEPRFCVGEHCRFCPAIAICKEQVRNACAVAKTDFKEEPMLPAPHELTVNDIAKVMKASEIFNAWAKEVTTYAQGRMELGIKIPGYKLVAKRSNRKWVDESMAASVLELELGEEAYEKNLLSIAKAEKILNKRGISPEAVLEGLVEKPDAGVTVAAEDDKRKEVSPTMISDFINDAEFLQ